MRLSANTELSGVGLSAAQRTNPLTVIVMDAGYPESVSSPKQFELFREATLYAVDKEPVSNWPRFETSFLGKEYLFLWRQTRWLKPWKIERWVAHISQVMETTGLQTAPKTGRARGLVSMGRTATQAS